MTVVEMTKDEIEAAGAAGRAVPLLDPVQLAQHLRDSSVRENRAGISLFMQLEKRRSAAPLVGPQAAVNLDAMRARRAEWAADGHEPVKLVAPRAHQFTLI